MCANANQEIKEQKIAQLIFQFKWGAMDTLITDMGNCSWDTEPHWLSV